MDEVRVAVVGVGRIGLTHAENLAHRVRGARLVAVTTGKQERADEARRRCGDVTVYPTLDALLAEAKGLDAVVISSSTSAHADNVEQCAAAGLHMLCEKPLALNATNGQIIAQITGSDESDDWAGKQVVLFHDPNVSYAGKLMGGIRVRAANIPQAAAPAAPPAPAPTAADVAALAADTEEPPF